MLQEVFSSFDNSLPKERKYESDTKLDNLTNTKRLLYLYTNQLSTSSCCAADFVASCAVGGAARGVAVISLFLHISFCLFSVS